MCLSSYWGCGIVAKNTDRFWHNRKASPSSVLRTSVCVLWTQPIAVCLHGNPFGSLIGCGKIPSASYGFSCACLGHGTKDTTHSNGKIEVQTEGFTFRIYTASTVELCKAAFGVNRVEVKTRSWKVWRHKDTSCVLRWIEPCLRRNPHVFFFVGIVIPCTVHSESQLRVQLYLWCFLWIVLKHLEKKPEQTDLKPGKGSSRQTNGAHTHSADCVPTFVGSSHQKIIRIIQTERFLRRLFERHTDAIIRNNWHVCMWQVSQHQLDLIVHVQRNEAASWIPSSGPCKGAAFARCRSARSTAVLGSNSCLRQIPCITASSRKLQTLRCVGGKEKHRNSWGMSQLDQKHKNSGKKTQIVGSLCCANWNADWPQVCDSSLFGWGLLFFASLIYQSDRLSTHVFPGLFSVWRILRVGIRTLLLVRVRVFRGVLTSSARQGQEAANLSVVRQEVCAFVCCTPWMDGSGQTSFQFYDWNLGVIDVPFSWIQHVKLSFSQQNKNWVNKCGQVFFPCSSHFLLHWLRFFQAEHYCSWPWKFSNACNLRHNRKLFLHYTVLKLEFSLSRVASHGQNPLPYVPIQNNPQQGFVFQDILSVHLPVAPNKTMQFQETWAWYFHNGTPLSTRKYLMECPNLKVVGFRVSVCPVAPNHFPLSFDHAHSLISRMHSAIRIQWAIRVFLVNYFQLEFQHKADKFWTNCDFILPKHFRFMHCEANRSVCQKHTQKKRYTHANS